MVKINSNAGNFADIIRVYIKNAFYDAPPIILCIGSDKATGDCLAPLVGTLLTKELGVRTHVYGTLDNPVHAQNVQEIYYGLRLMHPHRKILCIDSALGAAEDIGFVKLSTGGLMPGSAYGDEQCIRHRAQYTEHMPGGAERLAFGDFSILGVVNEKSNNKFRLFATRLKIVYELARSLSVALKSAIG